MFSESKPKDIKALFPYLAELSVSAEDGEKFLSLTPEDQENIKQGLKAGTVAELGVDKSKAFSVLVQDYYKTRHGILDRETRNGSSSLKRKAAGAAK